jgi:hypothetical protein
MMCVLFGHGRAPIANRPWKVFLILAAIFGAVTQPLFAKTNYVASMSQADMQSAITAASDGDTIVFPGGTASYSTPVTWTKAVTLQFTPGQSVILNTSGNRYGFALAFSANAGGKPIRITGLTMDGNQTSGGISIAGGQKNVRIDHCTFLNCSARAVQWQGLQAYGVMDHCSFTNCEIANSAFGAFNSSWTTTEGPGYGLGTTNGVYVEDCTVIYNSAGSWLNGMGMPFENGQGGRICLRHSVVNDTLQQAVEFWDSHGNNGWVANGLAGTVWTVVENNNVFIQQNYLHMYIRGGCFILISNTINSAVSAPAVALTEEEGWVTSFVPLRTAWPAEQQITNSWFVNNTCNGAAVRPILWNAADSIFIQQGRDYFISNNVPPPLGLNNPGIPGGMYGYTPLVYPHPRVTLDNGGGGPRTNATISVGPASYDFGSVQAGSSTNFTITVQNIGGGVLSGSASLSAPFSIVGTSSYSLASNATQNITVRFAPASAGNFNQSVNFTGGGGASVPVGGSAWVVQSGTTFSSTAGTLTSPFVASGNAVSQSVETLDTSSGGTAVYGFNIANAGSYNVLISVNAPSDGANSLFVNIDSDPITPDNVWDATLTSGFVTEPVTWRLTGGVNPQVWNLSAGVHHLIIRGREAGVSFGTITIAPSGQAKPNPPGNLRVVASGP